jgi:hypothetical protein
MNEDRGNFVENINWLGEDRLQFLLYAMRARNVPELEMPDLSTWPLGARSKRFLLNDEPWPIMIDLFERETPALPKNFPAILGEELTMLVEQGAVISWFMFEGAFGDIRRLFLPEQSETIYGIAWPGQPAMLAITQEARQHARWHDLLTVAAKYLEARYPNIRNIYV